MLNTKLKLDLTFLGTLKRSNGGNSETALRSKKIRMTIVKTPSFIEIHLVHNRKLVLTGKSSMVDIMSLIRVNQSCEIQTLSLCTLKR